MNNIRLIVVCVALIFVSTLGVAQTNAGSYLDTIYSASGTGTVRVLEGKVKRPVSVRTVEPESIPQHVQQGSFHEVSSKTAQIFDGVTDKQLMDDLYRLINKGKVVSIKNAKKRQPTTSKPGTIVGASVTHITIKTLPASSTPVLHNTLPNISQQVSDQNGSGHMYADLIKNGMGITLDGGFIGEGDPAKGYLWTTEQVMYLYEVLGTLPEHFFASTKSFQRVKNYMGKTGVLGYVYMGVPTVHICDWGVRTVKYEETIVHEMAHLWMFDKANVAAKDAFMSTFWPNGRRAAGEGATSAYGSTSVYEDFAESVRYYWQNGPAMKKSHPKRYEFIYKHVFKGFRYGAPIKIQSNASRLTVPKV